MRIGPYQIKLSLLPLVIIFAGIIFLVKLGLWQLARADEKSAILADIESRVSSKPLSIETLLAKQDKRYYQLKLTGRFDSSRWFYLDNRIINSQVGLEIIQPFYTDNKTILVNRGWIPLPRSREQLPDIQFPEGEVSLYGEVNVPTESIVLRDDSLGSDDNWPKLIQSIDMAALSTFFNEQNKPIEPWILRQKGDDAFYSREWINVNMPPERHTSYAVTWFGLAFALIIIYIAAATSRED